jgi:hypothetical protein
MASHPVLAAAEAKLAHLEGLLGHVRGFMQQGMPNFWARIEALLVEAVAGARAEVNTIRLQLRPAHLAEDEGEDRVIIEGAAPAPAAVEVIDLVSSSDED